MPVVTCTAANRGRKATIKARGMLGGGGPLSESHWWGRSMLLATTSMPQLQEGNNTLSSISEKCTRDEEHHMPLVTSFFRVPWRRKRARTLRMALQVALVTLLAIIILPVWTLYKPPIWIINILQRRSPQVLFHIPAARNVVALTIDDAPSAYTSQILDILQANDAAATFFTIGGQVAGREGVLEAIVKAGSELGNHAMHDEPSINVPSDALTKEIQAVDGMIQRAYAAAGQNRTMRYFRPGSGIFSQRVLDVANAANYRVILGSIYPHDPFIPYWRINAWHILSSLRPGAVIICHDRRSWTVPMLRKVIPEIKRRGYDIVTVSGLLFDTAQPT